MIPLLSSSETLLSFCSFDATFYQDFDLIFFCRSNLGGGEKSLFFTEADTGIVGNPYCIAFDWVGRNLYIGNIDAAEISLVRIEGKLKYRMLIIDSRSGNETGVAQPIALALHPNTGKLFWLDRGGNGVPAKIGKANMDGTEVEVIVQGNLEGPEFLTIDIQKEILYFSTSRQAKIESCNLDGTNRRVIISSEKNHPVAKPTGIAVMDRRLYYVDPVYEKVVRIDSSDGSNEDILLDNEPNLRTLNIFQKRQRKLFQIHLVPIK